MGGAMTKHINNKLVDICISTITKTINNKVVNSNSSITFNLDSNKNISILGNVFRNSMIIDINSFISALRSSHIENKIYDNIVNNSDLIDEGLASFFSKNEVQIQNEFTNNFKQFFDTLTTDTLQILLKNTIDFNLKSEGNIEIIGNTFDNTLTIMAKSIIESSEISQTLNDLSTKMSNSSSITVKNAVSIILNSLIGLISTPMIIFLIIIIVGGVILVTFNKSISNLLFGWTGNKKK